VASLIRSVGDFSLRTPHTGMMIYSPDVPKIPHAALAPEDSHRLARLAESGQRIVVRLKMSARTESPVESRNIIAEIRGREHPEEIIVLGGHFDSWDVGRGAQDDGGGCLSAWEAMRLIRELGLKPKRTLRCVLWNNEEFGLAGAKAYRDTHASELDRHVVALESDEGTFDPRGFSFVGSDAGMQLIQQIGEVLTANLRAGTIRRGGAQADVGPLLERGGSCARAQYGSHSLLLVSSHRRRHPGQGRRIGSGAVCGNDGDDGVRVGGVGATAAALNRNKSYPLRSGYRQLMCAAPVAFRNCSREFSISFTFYPLLGIVKTARFASL
jgi:hypothetical protein